MKNRYLAIFLIAVGSAMGQGSGTIQGTVTDPSGAVIPQASVTAKNVATGVETMRLTTAAGLYVLSPLTPGEYTISAAATGFQAFTQQHIVVDALANVGLNLQMKVGAANEQVTVEGIVATLHTEDATLGANMGNETYGALPLAMGGGVPRDPTQFIALSPGVAAVVTQSAGPSYTSFNGARAETNELYLEGIAMTFPNQQGDTRDLALGVSVEAVEQFQVEVNGQKAAFQGQGFHNYVLKSGTNRFHGAGYEYFRNTTLDARGFFSPIKPADHQNEFGGSVGGPIKKDKIFFFGNYSGYRFNTASNPALITIPSLAERNGDFSALPAVIYDPTTQVCNGAICSKQPFAGNILPANRLSSVAKSFQSYLPNPTNSNFTQNFLGSLPRVITNDNVTAKVDANLSDKNRLYIVFVRAKWATDYTGNLTPTGTALPLPYTASPGTVVEVPTIAQIHHTYLLKPSWLNTFSFGVTRIWIPIASTTKDFKYPDKAGLTGMPASGQGHDGFPTISFAGTNAPNAWGGTPFDEAENNYTLNDNVSWVHGKHSVLFGFQVQKLEDNQASPSGGTAASFSFSNNQTAGYNAGGTLLATTGNAYASYMLGAVSSASMTNNNVVEVGARFWGYSAFVQDDFKLARNLIVNYGVRWDVFGPYRENHDRVSYMDPNLPNPQAGGRPGALVYHSYGGIKTHYGNFAPKLGVAYSLDPKTVIRAGFVMNYSHGTAGVSGNGGGGFGRSGYNVATPYNATTTGLEAFYWDKGVPPPVAQPLLLTPGFGAGFTTENATSTTSGNFLDQNLSAKPPYYLNWSFGVQRELPSAITVGASYSASAGHFISGGPTAALWTNSIDKKYLALGSLLAAASTPANIAAARAIFPEIAIPFSNFASSAPINQLLKPFPQYSGVSCYSCDLGNSTYNSLQITATKRFSRGFTFQIGYTFSKELDDVPNGGQLGTVGGARDPYNAKLDKGLGAIDHRHLFHAVFVYDLPFGKGHQLGAGNAIVRGIVGGWQLSGILTYTSGAPLSVSGSGCTVTGVSSTCIASYNPAFTGKSVRINGDYGSGNALAPNAAVYFDKSAFINPAPYTFGNLPRSAPFGMFAPPYANLDATIRREFAIRESVRLSIAMDAFNATNYVAFAAPATNIDSANFGQVATSNFARKLQLNARITF
jgi:Carboxypeptidase regulatory-like domain/TonB dependent receptor